MTGTDEAHVLVIETGAGLAVWRYTERDWKKLSLTWATTRLVIDGVPIQTKFPRHLYQHQVAGAVTDWLHEQSNRAL